MSFFKKLIRRLTEGIRICKLKIKNPYIHKSVKFRCPSNITIGDDCSIGEHSYLYCWDKYSYEDISQELASHIMIGNHFRATRSLTIQSCGIVHIGNDVLVASNVFICDYNHGISNVERSYLANEITALHISIADGVWIGQSAMILAGVTIGRNSIIGAGSVVTKSVPEYCIAVGNPAKVIKKYDFRRNEWALVSDIPEDEINE